MLLPNQTLGKNIAYYRRERKLTQTELATVTGIPSRHLSAIETARRFPQINTIARLAAVLGVSIKELVEEH